MVSLVIYLRFFCSFLFFLFFFSFFWGRSIPLWTSLLLHHTDFLWLCFQNIFYISWETNKQKRCYSFYCVIHFNLMVGKQTHNVSEVCLYLYFNGISTSTMLQKCHHNFQKFFIIPNRTLYLWNNMVSFLFPFRLW